MNGGETRLSSEIDVLSRHYSIPLVKYYPLLLDAASLSKYNLSAHPTNTNTHHCKTTNDTCA
jgi:hypothetical protein